MAPKTKVHNSYPDLLYLQMSFCLGSPVYLGAAIRFGEMDIDHRSFGLFGLKETRYVITISLKGALLETELDAVIAPALDRLGVNPLNLRHKQSIHEARRTVEEFDSSHTLVAQVSSSSSVSGSSSMTEKVSNEINTGRTTEGMRYVVSSYGGDKRPVWRIRSATNQSIMGTIVGDDNQLMHFAKLDPVGFEIAAKAILKISADDVVVTGIRSSEFEDESKIKHSVARYRALYELRTTLRGDRRGGLELSRAQIYFDTLSGSETR